MSQPSIELHLPPEIYEKAKQIARATDKTVEAVLLDSISLLFGEASNQRLNPDDLANYTDEQLWAIVHQRLAWFQDKQLRDLIEKGKQESLSTVERQEMERLVDLVDYQMLLRSEALFLLKQRGHDVESKLKLGA